MSDTETWYEWQRRVWNESDSSRPTKPQSLNAPPVEVPVIPGLKPTINETLNAEMEARRKERESRCKTKAYTVPSSAIEI